MKVIALLIALGMMSGVAALAAGDAQAGKTVVDAKCKICHGANGEGNATLAKTLKVTFVPWSSKEVQDKTDGDLKKQITQGSGKMTAVKGLTDKQVDDVIAFIRSLAKS